MTESLKILVCGDVEGNITKLYSRVDIVNKKSGPFDYLFCVGNFFGSSDEELLQFKTRHTKAPVPTYVLGPNNSETAKFYPEVNGCELAPNITYLGKRGVYVTDSGLEIAYVSGVEDEEQSTECQVSNDDVSRVRNACVKSQHVSFRGIDILLTSEWPADVTKFDEKTIMEPPKGSSLISKLALAVRPRYHFFGLGKVYYERQPYRNQETGFGCHVTRAIALANVGNDRKQKWLYAMNLTPLKYMKNTELSQITTDTTECPYSFECSEKTQQFFYDMDYKTNKDRNYKRKNKEDFAQRNQKLMNISQNECWFCLASPQFEKHLVISIGEEAYLTLAKGGLVWDHVIILPISHYRSFTEMPIALCEEIKKFKQSLVRLYAAQGKVPIFFDRNFKTPHYQIQAIPVSSKLVEKVKQLFTGLAEEKNFSLTEIPDNAELEDILQSQHSYFYVEIANYRLIHTITKYFPLQFAREVLAHEEILNLPDRIEWKNCQLSQDEEVKTAERFRDIYKQFDFTV